MGFMLGNLSIEEMQEKAGVKFPDALVAYMSDRRQQEAADIEPGKWHCFDIPFTLVCGDMETASEIYKHLSPLSKDFREKMGISLSQKSTAV